MLIYQAILAWVNQIECILHFLLWRFRSGPHYAWFVWLEDSITHVYSLGTLLVVQRLIQLKTAPNRPLSETLSFQRRNPIYPYLLYEQGATSYLIPTYSGKIERIPHHQQQFQTLGVAPSASQCGRYVSDQIYEQYNQFYKPELMMQCQIHSSVCTDVSSINTGSLSIDHIEKSIKCPKHHLLPCSFLQFRDGNGCMNASMHTTQPINPETLKQQPDRNGKGALS